jgi:hypothetical protein
VCRGGFPELSAEERAPADPANAVVLAFLDGVLAGP